MIQNIKYFLPIIIALSCTSCDQSTPYDNGYEAAWNGENEPSWFSSSDYKDGFEQGAQDAYMYDLGYYDACNHKSAKYPKDPDYMDGYEYAKRSR